MAKSELTKDLIEAARQLMERLQAVDPAAAADIEADFDFEKTVIRLEEVN